MKLKIKSILKIGLPAILSVFVVVGAVRFVHAASTLTTSDFSLSDASVELDGSNDGSVEITFNAETSGILYALDSTWDTSITSDSSTIFTLASIASASAITSSSGTVITNNISTGQYSWIDMTVAGASISDNILTATYTVDKDTPSGTYDVEFYVDAIAYGSSADDSGTELTFTATITVTRADDPLEVTFTFDDNISAIYIYHDSSYTSTSDSDEILTTSGATTYLRDKDSGETISAADIAADSDVSGQINFTIVFDSGYSVDAMTVTGTYNQKKGPADTGLSNTYRITKVTSDLTVDITSAVRTQYTGTFDFDSNISSVEICTVQFSSDGSCEGILTTLTSSSDSFEAAARDGDTGTTDLDGSDQLNFRINPATGYKIDSVSAVPVSNRKNVKGASDTGLDNVYRITKITGDITIDIDSATQTVIYPTIVTISDQEYTGSEIKITPTVTASINGATTTLTEDTDYTVSYSTTNDYITPGSIITVAITSKNTSDYYFDTDVSTTYSIDKRELTSSNITASVTQVIEGNSLSSSSYVVEANGDILSADTDYTITIPETSSLAVGDTATVVIEGAGNYTGTINITVTIVDKYSQTVSFADVSGGAVSATYSDADFAYVATTTGDGAITYSSSDTSVATIDSDGIVSIIAPGETIITATAASTSTYNSGSASYTLTVAKKTLTISEFTVPDKTYDGTTDSEISTLVLSDSDLAYNTHYTATATYASADVGTDITVTAAVSLDSTASDYYELSSNTATTTATITALTLTSSNTAVSWSDSSYEYSGSANTPTPTVTVTINGSVVSLTQDTDYTVTYSDDTASIGSKTATISGAGNFTGALDTYAYTVTQASLSPSATIASQTYTGSALTPIATVTATFNGSTITLDEDVDYTLSYSGVTDAGDYTVTIKPVSTSNYIFSDFTTTFTISAYTLTSSDVALAYTIARYTGSSLEPAVTVTVNNNTISSDYYSVSYSDNIAVGTATATVTGSANLSGSIDKTFTIVDKDILTIDTSNITTSYTYTGSSVALNANPTVSGTNSISGGTYDINASDLTVTWYDSNDNVLDSAPTTVGAYTIAWSYSDDDCAGSASLAIYITQAASPTPAEMTAELEIEADGTNTLADLDATLTSGFAWDDSTTVVATGSNTYSATYTYNGDTTNYTTLSLNVPVYGLSRIDVIVSTEGEGGYTADTLTNILEGTSVSITFVPTTGYELSALTLDDSDVLDDVSNNVYTFTAGSSDMTVVATFAVIQYTLTISGTNVTLDPTDVIKVNYNSSQAISITTAYGYYLTSVLVNDIEMIDEVENNVITISNILEDTTIVISAERIIYEVTSGDGQSHTIGVDGDATFTINADYEALFEDGGTVYVDGELVDESYYTATSGSTVIALSASYLDTLSVGTHTLSVIFNDGGIATATFTIAQEAASTPNTGFFTNSDGDLKVSSLLIVIASLFSLLAGVFAAAKHFSQKRDFDSEDIE